MRIAILGAGFAGLSVAWYLLHYRKGSIAIDIFSSAPIGGAGSGLASGLLHAYSGKEARRGWRADSCMREAHRLLTEASHGLSRSLILSKGILRPAWNEPQIAAFYASAQQNPAETAWWDAKKCMNQIPGLHLPEQGGGLYVKNGLTIDTKGYLEGLWQNLARMGVQLYEGVTISQKQLEEYDRILFAMGPLSHHFPLLKGLPLTFIKGQVLDLEWPASMPPPSISLVSQKYLVMHPSLKQCVLGATFESQFHSLEPTQEEAAAEILPGILPFFPTLASAKIVGCRAGLRVHTPTRLPLVGQLSPKSYFFVGLGSKGLLQHAWIGKRVARALLSQNAHYLPHDLRYTVSPPL